MFPLRPAGQEQHNEGTFQGKSEAGFYKGLPQRKHFQPNLTHTECVSASWT